MLRVRDGNRREGGLLEDQLLTNGMLYILTGTFDTAAPYEADAEIERARSMTSFRAASFLSTLIEGTQENQ